MRGCACGDRDGVSSPELGVAHVSCLARQAKEMVAEAEEDKLGDKVFKERWRRWDNCSLCEQEYHGVVMCALGWACWKTYVGRPERDPPRRLAMSLLGNGLCAAKHHEDELIVGEAELAMERRFGASAGGLLLLQANLAITYEALGRPEAVQMKRDVYNGYLQLHGKEHRQTLRATNNYAASLIDQQRFREARSLLRKTMPVARRVFGESHEFTLKMRWSYAVALYEHDGATLDDLREAVTALEDLEQTTRRVLGGQHPLTVDIEGELQRARAALAARETPPPPPPSKSV